MEKSVKRTLSIIGISLAMGALLSPRSAMAGVAGVWATEGGNSHVRISPCGESQWCGEIVWLKEPNNDQGAPKLDMENSDEKLRGRTILGLPLLTGFKPEGENFWSGGEIYNPEDGKTYNSKMTLEKPDTLRVEGCVFVFCKAQTWRRVE